MKVLQITALGYVGGGSESIIVQASPYLLERGHSIKTLASDLGADKKHFNEYFFRSVTSTGPLKLLFFLFSPFSFFALRKVLDDYKPDIVHLHLMHESTPSILFLLKKYPTVMTLHMPESFLSKLLVWFLLPSDFKNNVYDKENLNVGGKLRYLYFNYIQKFPYKLGLKNVDIFIAPSKYMQNAAETDVSPVIHLPNFVEPSKFHELENNYNILFVGRLEKIKGIEFLIKALPLIIEVFPQTRLSIIGEGREKNVLLDLSEKLQVEQYVQFIGWVENKNLDTYYGKASIVVIPSICPDNFPTVCNEAMSAGRPVIGTNVGGIPEIIDDGINGYLVEPKNPAQIAEKVIKLFSEGNLEEFGKRARKKSEEFTPERYVNRLEKIYEQVAKKYKQQ